MTVNGWRLYAHPLFNQQLTKPVAQVESLAHKDPVHYSDEAATKLLATINRYIREIIPRDPNAAEFRQGNTLGIDNRHWFRAKFHERYRLFYRFSSKEKIIIYAWVNDERTLRKAGNPPEEDASLYPLDQLKFRPNVRISLSGQQVKGPARPLTSEGSLRQAMQGYYGGITGIDKEFARILKALDETGQAEDTIVFYTSDHGEMMGSQGRTAKQVPFEESCSVPFFVRYPGVTPKNEKSDMLFAAVDIYPTVCGLAGVPVPSHCVGHDFSAVMRGHKVKSPEIVFLMNEVPKNDMDSDDEDDEPARRARRKPARENGLGDRAYVNQPSYRGARTQTHTYAVAISGKWCLYDNVADPYQMKNLIHDPEQRPLMEKLDAMIVDWMKQTGDTFPYEEAKQKFSIFPV